MVGSLAGDWRNANEERRRGRERSPRNSRAVYFNWRSYGQCWRFLNSDEINRLEGLLFKGGR